MAVGCGAQCAKILLIVFNIIFWLSGAALLGLGIWMFVDDKISNYVKVFQAFDDGGAFIKYAAIVFICVGCFVLLVGFLGCCGAIKESRCMLGMYIAFLVIVMAAEIAAAVIVLIFKDEILEDMENEMVKLIKKNYGGTNDDTAEAFTEGMDYVQEELECCGVRDNEAEDEYLGSPFRDVTANPVLPNSCCDGVVNSGVCSTGGYYKKGCSTKIKEFVEDNSIILMVVGFVVAGIEIFGFIFAVCLCRNVGEED